ncbi:transcriptional regulator family: C2H2 zinc finger and Fungal Specific TF [Penicillium crustosum]|uniref:transcriptional regulator family: C2H2 zinc finger and Fungal Specific TF n=1 Tax=Penicillium crustosum TaxID=36656 RepID=UPI0023A5B865|nr:transcriptional regulator family: C2H2 zinc finger and Fungal Specific TF [Penicillium crustosum]KAJ5418291.1 transcriptional regulator family: C2H2 zinc finger and Fungal Specific TF [Penicillium crustosum]
MPHLASPWLIVGTSLAGMVSPCVWDPLFALCIGTVCWLVCRSSALWLSGPDIALVGSCLVCTFGVPLPSDPLIVGTSTVLSTYFPGSSLPATTATTNGVPRSAVERLNTPTFGGNFELPNYFTSPIISSFHQLRFPSVVVVPLAYRQLPIYTPSVISGLSNSLQLARSIPSMDARV